MNEEILPSRCDIFDEEDFNVDLYMLRCTENCSLQQLVTLKDTLDVEIENTKTLLQTTLCDNYSKYTAASDVISEIRGKFPKMSDFVECLEKEARKLQRNSDVVFNNLEERRCDVEKLMKSNENCQKWTEIADLPTKLRSHLNNFYYVEAAYDFLEFQHIWTKYSDTTTFGAIAKECKFIMSEVVENLGQKLDCSIYSKHEITEVANLLVQLGDENPCEKVLLLSRKKLSKILSNLNANTDSEGKTSDLWTWSVDFVDVLVRTVLILDYVQIRLVRNSEYDNFYKSSVVEKFCIANVTELFEVLKEKFRKLMAITSDGFLSEVLDDLYRKCYVCYQCIPKTKVLQTVTECILDIVSDRCTFHYQKLQVKFVADSKKLENDVDYFNILLDDLISASVNDLRLYIAADKKLERNPYFKRIFCKQLARERVFVEFIKFLTDANFLTNISEDDVNDFYFLVFARFILNLQNLTIEKTLQFVDDHFRCRSESVVTTAVSALTGPCTKAAEAAVARYVQEKQFKIFEMFKRSLENRVVLGSTKTPWKVSSVVKHALEEYDTSLKNIEYVLENESTKNSDEKIITFKKKESDSTFRNSDRLNKSRVTINWKKCKKSRSFNFLFGNKRHHKDGHFATFNSVQPICDLDLIEDAIVTERIDSLFDDCKQTSKTIEFQADFIMCRIIKTFLKSFLELVRLHTFGVHSFQQIQLDMRCLQRCIGTRHENMGSLFDDVVASAYHRAIDGELMNTNVVNFICNEFQVKLENIVSF